MQKLTLKNVLICLILFLLLTTMIISISSSYVMQKQTLVDNTLERHESYARKLADSAELSIQDAHKMLAESAKVIGAQFTQPVLDAEMERVIAQSSTFNSVSVINKDGIFVSAHPFKNFVGEHIVTEDALHVTVPMISKPYAAVTGRLVITLTYPIFNEAEDYLGYISGAIYLQEQNIFSALMETHFLQDDSYVFVVDEKGTIIYHQDRDRINEDVSSNAVVQEVLAQNSGATQVINSKNITMLAGYSFIEGANWGVVSQKPFLSTVLPAQQMVMNNFSLALPFLLIAVALSILFIAKIVKPIHILTELTKQNAEQQSVDKIRDVNGWYHEANQLKQTLFMTFTALQGKVAL
ncbi:MAG: cache domain-containing protein [Caryophanon sp.]|nr:cache domain-containing protein [Caryophanon sp.]